MDLIPDNAALIKPTTLTPTPTGNVQQNGINSTSMSANFIQSPGMNQALYPANFFQQCVINQTPTPSGYLQQNEINNSASLMQSSGMNQTLNQADFLQPYGMNQTTNSASFMQPPVINQTPNSAGSMHTFGTNQILNPTNFMQSPGMNHTINPANLLKLSETKQSLVPANYLQSPGDNVLNQTNFMQMNQNGNPMGYQQQYGMNPNLNTLSYQQQLGMNPNFSSMGSQQQFGMGFTTPTSLGQTSPFPMSNPQIPRATMRSNQAPARTPTASSVGSNAFASVPSGNSCLPIPTTTAFESTMFNVNQLPNRNCTMSRSMSTNTTAHQQPNLPVANRPPNLCTANGTNMITSMNTNVRPYQQSHVPVASGVPNFADMRMGTDSSQYLNVVTGLQNPSTGNGTNMNMNVSQTPSPGSCMNMNVNFPQTPSLGNGIPRRSQPQPQSQSQLPGAGSIKQAPRAKRNPMQAFGPRHPGPTRVKKTLSGNGNGNGASNVSECLKGNSHTRSSITPELRASTEATIATKDTTTTKDTIATENTVATEDTPSSGPQTSSQSLQQPFEQKAEQKAEQVQQQAQPSVQMSSRQQLILPVHDPVQSTVQDPEERPFLPPALSLEEFLIFVSDRHWEYWHQLNVLEAYELVEAHQNDERIRQAWCQRLADRWFSDDYKRVYELGGFLYEARRGTDGKFQSVTPIPWREYASCAASIRPVCCGSIDRAQALADVRARALGNIPPQIKAMDQAQARSEDIIGKTKKTEWWKLARLTTEMNGWMETLKAGAEPLSPSARQMGDLNAALIDAKLEME